LVLQFTLFVSGLQLAYTKKPEERNFRGVIALDECILEDGPEKENGAEEANGKSSKSKKASNGTAEDPTANLIFRVSHKVAYKTVLKGTLHSKHSLGLGLVRSRYMYSWFLNFFASYLLH
jgi:dynamin GTPase